MELAQALLKLWERKLWLAIGLVVSVVIAVGARQMLKSTAYAAATTQMIVDAPHSALGDIQSSLEPFTTRAGVYALLMTSPQALDAIGRAAGIPGSQISAQGPPEATLPQVGQTPNPPTSQYKLQFNQDPTLPTVDIYAQAPNVNQAVALADGAVVGFTRYLDTLEVRGAVPEGQRVQIRQLGNAIGGVVDASSSSKLAAIVALLVFILWCSGILLVSKMRALRSQQNQIGARDADAEPWLAGLAPENLAGAGLGTAAGIGTAAGKGGHRANGYRARQGEVPAPRDDA